MIRRSASTLVAALLAALGAACSPTLDWREFVPDGSGVSVGFPCRPDRQARPVSVAGARLEMDMLACSADGMTFAVAFADVGDPARVGPVLAALRQAAIGNVQGHAPRLEPFSLKSMTPNEASVRLTVAGQLPDGTSVHEQAAFFSRGLRIYQASVIGASLAPQALDNFFGALKFPP